MEEDGEDGSHSGDVALPVNHVREVIFHIRLAAPVCMGMLCNRFIAAVSVAFVGRLGPELLAAAALATTISNVTGNSVMVGLSGATNTLAGQAFGAGYFMEVGLVMQRGLCIVTCGLIPITAVWLVATPSLEFIGISPQLSARAGEYLVYLIPGLWCVRLVKLKTSGCIW
jgi:MATE family multidrug resistance protein